MMYNDYINYRNGQKMKQYIFNYLQKKRIPCAFRHDGKELAFPIRITKRDKFYRANGKVVSRNGALMLIEAGHAIQIKK